MTTTVVFGQEVGASKDIKHSLEAANIDKFEFLAINAFHPRFNINNGVIRNGPGTKSDRLLPCNVWIRNVVGIVSKWIDVESDDINLRRVCEDRLTQELNWCLHLGLQAVILPAPKRDISPNYCRLLKSFCSINKSNYMQLWLKIPFQSTLDVYKLRSDSAGEDVLNQWRKFYRLAGSTHKLSLAVEFDVELPDNIDRILADWKAEPVKALILPTRIFIQNKSNFPVLSIQHQHSISAFFGGKIHVIFKGKSRYDGYSPYMQYIRYLQSKFGKELSEEERFTSSYKDTLQLPLQPLKDNLESQTYETFEMDATKYNQYEKAIALALNKLLKDREVHEKLVVFVVGAGRGPLVICTQKAAVSTNANILVYVVEKNVNAVITLRNRAIEENWSNYVIIQSDMRSWTPPEQADIIVSELLGSFGCNELSPECCDGVQKHLKPSGIMIPQDSSSFIAPVSCSKLWICARDLPDTNGLNMPFVVKFDRFKMLSDTKKVFSFQHPNEKMESNTRFVS